MARSTPGSDGWARRRAPMALLLAALGALTLAGTPASGEPRTRAEAVAVSLFPAGLGRIDARSDDGTTATCDYTTVLTNQQECQPQFARGSKLELTAIAEPDATTPSEFVHWSRSDCLGNGSCTITVGDEDWVSAVFTPLGLEVGIRGDGEVTVEEPDGAVLEPETCDDWLGDVTACLRGSFAADERVVLLATPTNAGDAVHWGTRCEEGSSGATCVVRVTNTRTFATVGFGDNQPPDDSIPFDISPIVDVQRTGSGSGTVKGSGKDARGDDWSLDCPGKCKVGLAFQSRMTLTAQEDDGSRFVRWERVCSTDRACTFSAGSETHVIAVFDALPPAQTNTQSTQTQTQPTQTQPTQTQPPQKQPPAFSPQIRRVTPYTTKSTRGLRLVLVVDRTASAKASLFRKVVVRKRTRLRSVAGSTFALAKGRNSVRLALRKGLAAGWYTLSIRFVGPGGESAVVTRPIRWRP